ncbi:hypothetical protein AXG93_2632s1060 [Marchantia polymorpha subsp. ruderalis]|uniref:Secreted protein n=1 Tax=Marchantia polymorpha subsp. ruderalis TaxID=1480154 RepID=A0A176VV33_MARPO|nr:hypothetical protein AXG93_2632s1060 [Marchantia polymorpha subsp. ruderalis]
MFHPLVLTFIRLLEFQLLAPNSDGIRADWASGPTSQSFRGILSPEFTVATTSCTSTVWIQSTPQSKVQTRFIVLLHRAAAASARRMQFRERRCCLPHGTVQSTASKTDHFALQHWLDGSGVLIVAAAAGPGPINYPHRTLLLLRLSAFSFSWKKLRLERLEAVHFDLFVELSIFVATAGAVADGEPEDEGQYEQEHEELDHVLPPDLVPELVGQPLELRLPGQIAGLLNDDLEALLAKINDLVDVEPRDALHIV